MEKAKRIHQKITNLALEEIRRIYGINNPDRQMLGEMVDVIEGWPMIQAVLGSKK